MLTATKQRKRKRVGPTTGLVIDNFAGAGGASLGMEKALGRSVDIAINHNPLAIDTHTVNHPETRHIIEDLYNVDPLEACRGEPVDVAWFSPDCTFHSSARGSKPIRHKDRKVRGLAWILIKWLKAVKPRLVFLENVREFEKWGPVVPRWTCRSCEWRGTEGQAVLLRRRRRCPSCESLDIIKTSDFIPCPERKGITFKRFIAMIRNCGYSVEWKVLDAAAYGAATHRRRLFLVARRDSRAIAWPKVTHGKEGSGLEPYHTAAEHIDFSIPCPSIFDRRRPLAENTLRRIALGIDRYVLNNPKPFIIRLGQTNGHGNYSNSSDDPLSTVTSKAEHCLVVPTIVNTANGESHGSPSRVNDTQQPIGAVTGKGRHALAAATLISVGYGEREGQSPRVPGLDKPIGTVTAGGNHAALVTALIAKHFGGAVGTKVDSPLPTTLGRGTQSQLVAANLIRMGHGEKQWDGVEDPLGVITAQGNKFALIYSFLIRYFGTAIGQHLTEPIYTITGKDRFGLVLVRVEGDTYVLSDIGMRILTPRELARCQGFPDSYVFLGPKSRQVDGIGNSVVPLMAKLLVLANY